MAIYGYIKPYGHNACFQRINAFNALMHAKDAPASPTPKWAVGGLSRLSFRECPCLTTCRYVKNRH